MTRRLLLLVLTVFALVVGLAACGGDDDGGADEPAAEETTEDGGGGGGAPIPLATDPGGALAFDQTELTAAAGEVTIELTNESGISHNVAIDGTDAVSETITEGTTSVTVKVAFRSGSSQHGKARRASVDSNCVVAIVRGTPASSV